MYLYACVVVKQPLSAEAKSFIGKNAFKLIGIIERKNTTHILCINLTIQAHIHTHTNARAATHITYILYI